MSRSLNRFVFASIFLLLTQTNFGASPVPGTFVGFATASSFGQSTQPSLESRDTDYRALVDDVRQSRTRDGDLSCEQTQAIRLLSDGLLSADRSTDESQSSTQTASTFEAAPSPSAWGNESISIAETRSIESACLEADGIVKHLNQQATRRFALQKAQLADVLTVALDGANDAASRRRAIETALTMASELGTRQAQSSSEYLNENGENCSNQWARQDLIAMPSQRLAELRLREEIKQLTLQNLELERRHQNVVASLQQQISFLSNNNQSNNQSLSMTHRWPNKAKSPYRVEQPFGEDPSKQVEREWNVTLLPSPKQSSVTSRQQPQRDELETDRERLPTANRRPVTNNMPKSIAIAHPHPWPTERSTKRRSLEAEHRHQKPLLPLPTTMQNVSTMPEVQAIKAEVMRLNQRLDALLREQPKLEAFRDQPRR